MSDLVFHMVLFTIAGTVLVMAPLLVGRLVRPNKPNDEKDAVYECGEPTIGSSFIQWDLRFYTVALLFIVFDVEVAFFFPWATLYGGTMQLADSQLDMASRQDLTDKLLNQVPGTSAASGEIIASGEAFQLGLLAFSDILVFFGVLLVGFAYVWKRGDLEWVRAAINTSSQRANRDGESLRT
ncbi:MAG: NADH-quinone oxidoreductase subunit A [Rhodopirellula sp.]|nr:NADH-quinone oxidoreductase subunit A [Rhodopirellula sp.]